MSETDRATPADTPRLSYDVRDEDGWSRRHAHELDIPLGPYDDAAIISIERVDDVIIVSHVDDGLREVIWSSAVEPA